MYASRCRRTETRSLCSSFGTKMEYGEYSRLIAKGPQCLPLWGSIYAAKIPVQDRTSSLRCIYLFARGHDFCIREIGAGARQCVWTLGLRVTGQTPAHRAAPWTDRGADTTESACGMSATILNTVQFAASVISSSAPPTMNSKMTFVSLRGAMAAQVGNGQGVIQGGCRASPSFLFLYSGLRRPSVSPCVSSRSAPGGRPRWIVRRMPHVRQDPSSQLHLTAR